MKDWRDEEAQREIVVAISTEERIARQHSDRAEHGVTACVEGRCGCWGHRQEDDRW